MNFSQSDARGGDPREEEIAAGLESANLGESADQPVSEPAKQAVDSHAVSEESDSPSGEDATAWRDEVAARLGRYRARRKPRPPRYPSLRLRFEPGESLRDFKSSSGGSFAEAPSATENVSYRGLALDASTSVAVPLAEEAAAQSVTRLPPRPSDSSQSGSGAKIIEFPRLANSEMPTPVDELAEPVVERPRILEAPEIAPAPALGGITIAAAEQKEIERRPGIDFPLQSAPLARRIGAGVGDGTLVLVAAALFAFVFWKIAGVQPPRGQIVGLAVGIPCLLWAAYQFLLIVYSGRTPGLWMTGLEITDFDGTRPSRRRRRWRVVASYLSAISLGMGYAWVFLDEDALCWHDRITHTYLAPKARHSR